MSQKRSSDDDAADSDAKRAAAPGAEDDSAAPPEAVPERAMPVKFGEGRLYSVCTYKLKDVDYMPEIGSDYVSGDVCLKYASYRALDFTPERAEAIGCTIKHEACTPPRTSYVTDGVMPMVSHRRENTVVCADCVFKKLTGSLHAPDHHRPPANDAHVSDCVEALDGP
jgi:hypothetical protein